MLKFDGPHFENTAHARLLYKSFCVDGADFGALYQSIEDIDRFILESPRLHKAHENAYIYFFGPDATEFWVGREITGFVPHSVQNYHVFDSFRGEAVTWNILDSGKSDQWTIDQWCHHSEQLRSLASEALASTWRVKIGPLEMISGKTPLKSPLIAFQFFKTH